MVQPWWVMAVPCCGMHFGHGTNGPRACGLMLAGSILRSHRSSGHFVPSCLVRRGRSRCASQGDPWRMLQHLLQAVQQDGLVIGRQQDARCLIQEDGEGRVEQTHREIWENVPNPAVIGKTPGIDRRNCGFRASAYGGTREACRPRSRPSAPSRRNSRRASAARACCRSSCRRCPR